MLINIVGKVLSLALQKKKKNTLLQGLTLLNVKWSLLPNLAFMPFKKSASPTLASMPQFLHWRCFSLVPNSTRNVCLRIMLVLSQFNLFWSQPRPIWKHEKNTKKVLDWHVQQLLNPSQVPFTCRVLPIHPDSLVTWCRLKASPQAATVVNKTCRVRLLSVNNAGGCHSVQTSLRGCRRDGDASDTFVIAVPDSRTAHWEKTIECRRQFG